MSVKVYAHERFGAVYWVEINGQKRLATLNLARGTRVYGEQLVESGGVEYRIWDPYRSKLAAAILNGLKVLPIAEESNILYLGAASGTTSSHVSDIVGQKGRVYCVEISARPLRDLLQVCANRSNMIPIMGDARDPSGYSAIVEKVNVVYQDIAQPDQTDIMLINMRTFLKEGGYGMLVLKARSIDVTRKPEELFREETEKLEGENKVIDIVYLEPYEKDHAMILIKRL
ncbi:MAG: fibrillarin-like rRNA/tRNA 2'-O-methyltransferase [Candidatus Hadarchaeales archaeon]